jgi:hypothetical protein
MVTVLPDAEPTTVDVGETFVPATISVKSDAVFTPIAVFTTLVMIVNCPAMLVPTVIVLVAVLLPKFGSVDDEDEPTDAVFVIC